MKKKVVKKHNNSGNCFICGINSPFGLNSRFYELEDGTVACLVTAKPEHQSYPLRVHGGVIAALLDETLGRAINVSEPETLAVTGDISVRFKKPVPYGEPLLVTGRVIRKSRLIFESEGNLYLKNGTLVASDHARYTK